MMGVAITLILAFQTFTMPSRIALSPFLVSMTSEFEQGILSGRVTYPKPIMAGKLSLLSNSLNSSYSAVVLKEAERAEISEKGKEADPHLRTEEIDEEEEDDMDGDDDVHLGEDGDIDAEFTVELGDGDMLKKVENSVGGLITLPNSLEKVGGQGNDVALISVGVSEPNRTFIPKQNIPLGNKICFHDI